MMSAPQPYIQALIDCRDVTAVGGKALNLGRLLRAGFPVPNGFVITAAAFRAAQGDTSIKAQILAKVSAAWQAMGSLPVAVRSSATAEDGAETSWAGQCETYLDRRDADSVIAAVNLAWNSLSSERVAAYISRMGIASSQIAMAVVVQCLIPADVAGVLFTTDPVGSEDHVIIEAAPGLGEAVVSGHVQPDYLHVDPVTGATLSLRCGDTNRSVACIDAKGVEKLWQTGLAIAAHYGEPQDIEWAIASGQLWVLQSRPITTIASRAQREELLKKTRAQLTQRLETGASGWVRHDLSETAPHPTPVSAGVLQRFMSGHGGYGGLYRIMGLTPSSALDNTSVITMIAGRIYLDLQRAPWLFGRNCPFSYDLDLLRKNPGAAQQPPTVANASGWAVYTASKRMQVIVERQFADADEIARQLISTDKPRFLAWCNSEAERDLTKFNAVALDQLFYARERTVLSEFAPLALRPGFIAAIALDRLRSLLVDYLPALDVDATLALAGIDAEGDVTVRSSWDLHAVANGKFTVEKWLSLYGHRASGEFDLAEPRWHEQPAAIATLCKPLVGLPDPRENHRHRHREAQVTLSAIIASLPLGVRPQANHLLQVTGTHLRAREEAKHVLMRGYASMRAVLLAMGKLFKIDNGIFLLNDEERACLVRTGIAPLALIAQRQRERRAEAALYLPAVIDAQAVVTLGTVTPTAGSGSVIPLSPGQARGRVVIRHAPVADDDIGTGYVLVCPSTDPSWTPLLLGAVALVVERGGVLSHGAVIARELGVPAVVLPDATQRLQAGTEITVAGLHGSISEAQGETLSSSSDDALLPNRWLPPGPGAFDRRMSSLRDRALIFWLLFIAALFVLPPALLYQPVFGLMDVLVWPLIPTVGPVLAAAIMAVITASATLLTQRLTSDLPRLHLAQERAKQLEKEAAALPPDSLRADACRQAAKPVGRRIAISGLNPLGLLLGPMVVSFLWLGERLAPIAQNADIDAPIQITATVAGDYRGAIMCAVTSPFMLEGDSERTLPPIRSTLQNLQRQWSQPFNLDHQPWAVQAAALATSQQMRVDLAAYLAGPMPDETVRWTVRAATSTISQVVIRAGADSLTVPIAIGARHPTQVLETLGDGLIRQVMIIPPPSRTKPIFWAPFTKIGWAFDFGWLGVYILAYLPPLFILRKVLRLP